MDTKVISDVVGPDHTPSTDAAPEPPRRESVEERSLRRFAFDPASAPNMMAAFAWNTAGIRA